MDRLLAMTVFARVVEAGSFARAADRLDLSNSAVSRHVADLEQHLGVRLLHRTTRRLALTEAGEAYHVRCVQLLADLEDAESGVSAGASTARGTIRLTASINFGVRHLAPLVAAFIEHHPLVRVDVALSDHRVDLVEAGLDLAIRIGAPGGDSLVARRLAESRLVLCASPDYLRRRGTPRTLADLATHDCLLYHHVEPRNVWSLLDRKGREHSVRVSGPVDADNGDFLVALAAAGLGIAMEPDFIVGPELADGRLVRILEDWRGRATGIYAVYPSRRHLPAKVRLFVDFLADQLRARPSWT